MPLLRAARAALVLALAFAAPGALEAQGRAGAPSAVTLVAHAAPRLMLVELATTAVIPASDTLHITHRVTTDANISRAVVVRRTDPDPLLPIEVRDRRGMWVPLGADQGIVVLETEELGRLVHVVECRVAAPAASARECPLAYELTSRDPLFPMRVTARPAATLAGR